MHDDEIDDYKTGLLQQDVEIDGEPGVAVEQLIPCPVSNIEGA